MTLGIALGFAAAALTFTTFMMKSMLPLRVAALASNVFFVAYGCVESLLPIVILHGVLLLLNAARLLEIRKLVKDIESAAGDTPVAQRLLPHMTRRTAPAGTTLFSRATWPRICSTFTKARCGWWSTGTRSVRAR